MTNRSVLMLRRHVENDLESELSKITFETAALPPNQTPRSHALSIKPPLPRSLFPNQAGLRSSTLSKYSNTQLSLHYPRGTQSTKSQTYSFNHHTSSSAYEDLKMHIPTFPAAILLWIATAQALALPAAPSAVLSISPESINTFDTATVVSASTTAAIPSPASPDSPPSAKITPAKRDVLDDLVQKVDDLMSKHVDLKPGETSINGRDQHESVED